MTDETITPETPNETGAIAAALAKAQAKMGNPKRNRSVKVKGYTKDGKPYEYDFAYATLDQVLDTVRPALTEQGIAIVGYTDIRHRLAGVRLVHSSGQTLSCEMPIVARDGAGAQEWGSALTYARRYALVTLLGIAAEEDDDGNAAEGNQVEPQNGKSKATHHASGNGQAKQAAPTSKRGPYRLYDAAGELVHEFPGTRDGAEQALKHLESYAETEPSTALANLELLQRAAKAQGDFGKRAQQVLDTIQPKEAAE